MLVINAASTEEIRIKFYNAKQHVGSGAYANELPVLSNLLCIFSFIFTFIHIQSSSLFSCYC
jgi:hypothetical protein